MRATNGSQISSRSWHRGRKPETGRSPVARHSEVLLEIPRPFAKEDGELVMDADAKRAGSPAS